MNDPRYIIIHTAASGRDGKPIYQPFEVVKAYHTGPDLNWTDIGYHYYIEGDGKVVPGRAETTTGAHCKDMGMNSQSIGICCAGHGDLADFNEAQYASLYALCLDVMERYDIPVENVWGHREANNGKKTCPGKLVNMHKFRWFIRLYTPLTPGPTQEIDFSGMDVPPFSYRTSADARTAALEARVAILEEKVNGLAG